MVKRIPQTAIAALLIAGGATAAAAQGNGSGDAAATADGQAQAQGEGQGQALAPHVRRYMDILDQNAQKSGIQNAAPAGGVGYGVRPDEPGQAQQQAQGGQDQMRQPGQRGQMQGIRADQLPPGTVLFMVPQQALDPGTHDPQSRMSQRSEPVTQANRGAIAIIPGPSDGGQQQALAGTASDQRGQPATTPYEQGYAEFLRQEGRMPAFQGGQPSGQSASRQSAPRGGQQGVGQGQQSAATPYEQGYENLRENRLRALDRGYQAWRDETARQMDQMAREQSGQQMPQRQASAPDQVYVDPRTGAMVDPDVAYVTPQGFVIIDQRPDVPGIQPVQR